MVTKQLNPAQLNVLTLMSYIDTEQEQQELQGHRAGAAGIAGNPAPILS